MSIENKLTYLDGTKQALKESINNLGGDITSETTFREYAQELDNIYDNLPKTTGEDTTLSLTTLKGKMGIIPKGNIEQEIREGYNLFQAKLQTTTANGITVTNNNNGTFTINGTNTSTSLTTFRLDQSTQNGTDNLQNYEDGTYTLDIGIQNENIQMTLMQVNTWQQFIATGMNVRLKSGAITGATGMFIYIAIKGNATINNVVIKPMFVKGSYTTSTIPSFEPYVGGTASPNPSFPQDIEVVTGTQEVKVENVNKLPYASESTNTINDMVFTSNGKGTYTLNGTASATSYYDYSISEYTIKSTDYLYLKNTETNSNISVALLNGNTQIMYTGPSQINRVVSLNSYAGSTINTLRIRTTAQTLSNFTLKPMIAEITTLTDFVEHQEQTQTISLGDIELCKIGNYQDYLYKSGNKWYKKENIYKIANKTNWVIGNIVSNNRATFGLVTNGFLSAVNIYSGINCISNSFIAMAQGTQGTTTEINNICINGSNMYIKFADTINTKELAKAQLDSMTNFIAYYILETPNDIQITNTTLIEQLDNIQKLKSYNGVTNINCSGNLSAILSISALKGE